MKTLLPVLTASLFLVTGCNAELNSWLEENSQVNGLARLEGTVIDTPFAADADLQLQSYDEEWLDLSATTNFDDRDTMGMMFAMGEITPSELFAPGRRSIRPMLEGGQLDVMLCGETDGEYYDEPADDIVITVEEDEGGGRSVLLRGSAQGGERFQQVAFQLDADLRPVLPEDL